MSDDTNNDILSIYPEKCTQLTSVNLPIITKSRDKAICILGGLESISKSIDKQSSTITADIGTQPLRRPLIGERGECSGILLRLRKKKSNSNDSNSEYNRETCKVDVIGYVNSQYTFNQSFDFQFLPISMDPQGVNKDHPLSNIIEAIPKQFTHQQIDKVIKSLIIPQLPVGVKSKFDSSSDETNKTIKIKDQSIKSKGTESTCFIKFTDEPLALQSDPNVFKRSRKKFESIYSLLTKLFSFSPVWTRKQLSLHSMISNNGYATAELLPNIAYCYTNGPFRGCWVKYGVDLRSDCNYRIFQLLKVKILEDHIKLFRSKIITHLESEYKHIPVRVDLDSLTVTKLDNSINTTPTLDIVAFGTHIKRQCSFEMTYLRDQEIMNFISECHWLSYCDIRHGWFLPNNLKQLRILIVNKIFDKINIFTSTPINDLIHKVNSNNNLFTDPMDAYNDVIIWNNNYLNLLCNNYNLTNKSVYINNKKSNIKKVDIKSNSDKSNDVSNSDFEIESVLQGNDRAQFIKETIDNQLNDTAISNLPIDATMKLLLNNSNLVGFDVFNDNDNDSYSEDDDDEDDEY